MYRVHDRNAIFGIENDQLELNLCELEFLTMEENEMKKKMSSHGLRKKRTRERKRLNLAIYRLWSRLESKVKLDTCPPFIGQGL